jgi:hypothetical protein
LGAAAQSQLVGSAVRMMRNLDEMAVVLARQGLLPRFTLPERKAAAAPAGKMSLAAARELDSKMTVSSLAGNAPLADLESAYESLDRSLQQLRQQGRPEARLLIARHRESLAQHISDVDAIVTSDLRKRSPSD